MAREGSQHVRMQGGRESRFHPLVVGRSVDRPWVNYKGREPKQQTPYQ